MLIIISVFLCIIALIFALYFLFLIRHEKMVPKETLLCSYAHRGLHNKDIPENSLAAFEEAVKKGYGIELDVQLSSDGEVMVFHDHSLLRMTGVDKNLRDLTCLELQELYLSGSKQTIPTLHQVLSLVDGKVPILVELKGENLDTSLCEKVAILLREYNGAYFFESFNPLLIGKIKKFLPDAFCGLIYTNVCRDKKKYSVINIAVTLMLLNFLTRPNFISYNQMDRNTFLVRITTKFYQAPKFVWTVRTETEYQKAYSLGEYPIFEKIKQ